MNQRESSGLPLRAMVMVLLFLGIVFVLVGFQALRSSDDSDADDTTVATSITTKPTTSSAAPQPNAKADVRVYNISEVEGAAENVANRLRDSGWNVTETGNLTLDGVTATTVYYSDAPGEHAAADEVGKLLEAPVEERLAPLADQPPGVIVAVTG
jgi:LytR cell envelope-related transcriptional attenuator